MEVKNIHLNDFIKVYDSILDEEVLVNFLDICKNHEYEQARVGKNKLERNIRKTDVWYLSNQMKSLTTAHWYNFLTFTFKNKFIEYMKFFFNNKIDHMLPTIDEIQVLKYEKTFHYKFHTDHSFWSNRQWSGIFFLNDDYKGGDLLFSTPDGTGELKIEKKKNRMIIWPSNFMYPHSVLPVEEGVRYSVVTWAR